MVKRIIASLVLLCICMFSITPVAATSNLPAQNDFHSKLIEALQEILPQKNIWGLEDVCFENLSVGTPVHTYYYVDNELTPGQALYPITENQRLVLWAIEQDGSIQLSNGLVNEINNVVASNTQFSLIYDAVATYLYTPQTLFLIAEYSDTMSNRSVLPENIDLNTDLIVTTALSDCTSLGFISTWVVPQMVSCNISFVPQSGNNTCWAASIACICNYLGGSTLTDQDVVGICLGNPMLDTAPQDVHQLFGYLSNFEEFSPYTYNRAFGPSGSFDGMDIHGSIYEGYPVLGIFYNLNDIVAEHACTIYSSNIIAGRMGIMDPYSGSHTATMNEQTDTYSYYSTRKGANYHLYYAYLVNE